jgi:hypothetical protein
MDEQERLKLDRTRSDVVMIGLGVAFAIGGIVAAVVAGPQTAREAAVAANEGRTTAEVVTVTDRYAGGRTNKDYFTPTVSFSYDELDHLAVLQESDHRYVLGESVAVRFNTLDPSIALDVDSTAPSGVLITTLGVLGLGVGLALLAWSIYSAARESTG